MKPTDIEMQIDELVLHGFPPGDRYRISEAAERELVRLFTEQGRTPELSQRGEVAHVDGGAFAVGQSAEPETTGAQIAQSLFGALT